MAELLVSVTSGIEARCALAGGASIIDVKDPTKGSLGRARSHVWREVRAAVPASVRVSVALGELVEWEGNCWQDWVEAGSLTGITFVKVGLARAGRDWRGRWVELAKLLRTDGSTALSWVAVSYVDWREADAPEPNAVIDAAEALEGCAGVLFDTWDKRSRSAVDVGLKPYVERVHSMRNLVAVSGSLDAMRIEMLAELRPDIWAVRGAACGGGERTGTIDADRVRRLATVVEGASAV